MITAFTEIKSVDTIFKNFIRRIRSAIVKFEISTENLDSVAQKAPFYDFYKNPPI